MTKSHQSILVFVFLFIIQTLSAQSQLVKFFRTDGAKLVATLAHPTNTFKYANYKIKEDYIWIDAYYDGYNTELKLYRTGVFFTSIEVLSDNDFFEPFVAAEILKDMAWKTINTQQDQEVKTKFEQYFDKTVANMTGKELTCLLVTLAWLDY